MTDLVIISDTHGREKALQLGKNDLAIFCGDWSPSYDGTEEEAQKFAYWYGTVNAHVKVAIPGNHDTWAIQHQESAKALFMRHGIHLLVNESFTIPCGLSIYANSRVLRHGKLSYENHEADAIWSNMQKCDILVTHVPPLGILDAVGGRHTGCVGLLNAVLRMKPSIHCFGHIHEAHGKAIAESYPTLFLNATSWDHHTNTMRKPVKLRI